MSEEENINEPKAEARPNDPIGRGEGLKEQTPQPTANDQPSITSDQPSTVNMEVHKHPHHVTHKKKWGEYLLEFFMLFLAVFLGFIAENVRENNVEKRKATEYIESIIEDIKLDTASINKVLAERILRIVQFDSLFISLNIPGDKTATNDLYYYSRLLLRNTEFAYHNRTISQIKNSGEMRLIKKACSDSITIYDNEIINGIFNEQQFQSQLREQGRNYIGNIFDAAIYNVMIDSSGKLSRPQNNPPILTIDKIILNQFSLQIHYLKGSYIFSRRQLKEALASAVSLILFLKKEYHLE